MCSSYLEPICGSITDGNNRHIRTSTWFEQYTDELLSSSNIFYNISDYVDLKDTRIYEYKCDCIIYCTVVQVLQFCNNNS